MSVEHAVWQRPALQEQVLRRRHDGRAEIALHVAALDRPRRVLALEQGLHALPGVVRVKLEPAARRVRVAWDDTATSLPQLLATCDALGCAARPLHAGALRDARRDQAHDSLKRLVVAGLFAMQAMMFATVLYVGAAQGIDDATRALFRWLGLLAATPVVTYAAWPFLRRALADLRARRLGTDVPVALAALAIYAASAIAAVRGVGEVYFDSVSMLVFALLLGRHLELRERHRHAALGDAAAESSPVLAQRRCADGSLEAVAAVELQPGDSVHVEDGGVVPADGMLDAPRARIDIALLDGESRPRAVRRGERVPAGSVVVEGPLELRVERAAADSRAAALGALAARAARPCDDGNADPAGARFVARVLTLALAATAFWLWRDPARAFDAAVAVLVVACPCAFALAAPVTRSRALAMLARRGVLATRPDALIALAHADCAVFDKTGTLTRPQLDLSDVEPLRGDDACTLLAWAAALARENRHPVSEAVLLAASAAGLAVPPVTEVETAAGVGLSGTVSGRRLRLGREDDALVLADTRGALARLHLHERLRDDAAPALQALRGDGLEIELSSGDIDERVEAAAAALHIADWHARQSAADKMAHVEALRRQGRVVLAVGDGGNDAPLLAAADVSATRTDGAGLARAHADLLLDGGLDALPKARHLAVRAAAVLAQNRRGSLAYNLAAVPFAAFGLVPPWLAAIGMSASSLLVVANALRIGRTGAPVGSGPAPRVPLRERRT